MSGMTNSLFDVLAKLPADRRAEATGIIADLCLERGFLDRYDAGRRLITLIGAPAIDLQWRWTELCRHYGVKQTAAIAEFQAIENAYREPGRAYHTLGHIRDCLRELSSFEGGIDNRFTVEMAIWFHDFVYSTKASDNDNEIKSAAYAGAFCDQNGIAKHVRENIKNLILYPTHKEEQSFYSDIYKDIKFFQDIDLSILGRSPEVFQAYEENIQKEYSHVPGMNFIEGRLKILMEFQDRKYIYETQIFGERYEKQARKNIAESINKLRANLKAITDMVAEPAVKLAACESKAFIGWDDGGYSQACKLESGHQPPCVADIKVGGKEGGQAGGCDGTLTWNPKRKSDHA